MSRAEKRRQRKLAEKAAKNAKSGQPANPSPRESVSGQRTLNIPQSLNLAVQHHTAGRLPEAEGIYQQILQADPHQPVALHLLGVIAHQEGKNDIAVELITKALAIKPDFAEAHSNLGLVLQDLGRLDDAVASYNKALAVKPDFAGVHYNLGIAFKKLGKLDEAVASYEKSLAVEPDPEVYLKLGSAHQERGRLEDAVAIYHKALALYPDFAEAHNNLGNAFKKLGRLDEAVASYHKALDIKPDYAEAHNNLGNAFNKLGKLDEAVASHKKAISIKPDSPEVQHLLNSLLGNTTDCAPREYVEKVFNSYAEKFDNHLVNDLAYKTPALLKKAVLDLGLVEGKLKKVIDLGCGTGLAGVEFRDVAESLIGIDLSKNMIRKAEEKNVYDELYVDDIIDRLESLGAKFELFISTDVFIYIGDLRPLFHCVKKHSRKNSLFVFSTEHTDCNDFVLNNTCRYAHSKDYVLSIATELGFKIESFTQNKLRKERDDWIIGAMYILRSV